MCYHLVLSVVEQFSNERRQTKTKVITLANHKGHRQSSEPIKTRSKYMQLARSAGKHARASRDLFWFYFRLVEQLRDFFKPITGRSNGQPKQARITFYTQVKTVLYQV